VHPVAEGVEAREGDVARADHQRHEVDGECLGDRHAEQEHHRRAAHGEELVVEIRPDEVALRPRELHAHHRGERAAEQKESERGEEIALADDLVVDRREPADQARGRAPGPGEAGIELGFAERGVAQVAPVPGERGLAHLKPSR
jgi:hypothetical protein